MVHNIGVYMANVLVIILASPNSTEFENANLVFEDLFDKVKPDKIFALRTDSSTTLPQSLMNKEIIKPISIPSIINQDFFSGSQDPELYWAEYLQQIIPILNLDHESKINLHINAGDFWTSSMLFSLSKIFNSQIWATVRDDDIYLAKNITPIKYNSDSERAIISHLCDLKINNSKDYFSANDLQESNIVPNSKGIENALRNSIDLGLIERRKVDFDKSNEYSITYKITPKGLLHGFTWNDEDRKNLDFKSIKDSVLLIQRATKSSTDIDDYIKEHGLVKFTAASLLIVDFSNDKKIANNKPDFEKILSQNWPKDSITTNILSDINYGQSEDGASKFMEMIHRIVNSKNYDWTILSTGIPSSLRSWVMEYALQRNINIKHVLHRHKSPSGGSRGSIIHHSGLPKSNHLLSLPSLESLELIKTGINNKNKWIKESLVTLLLNTENKPIKRMGTNDGIISFNNDLFSSNHRMFMNVDKKNISTTQRDISRKLIDLKLVNFNSNSESSSVYYLTPEGRVTALIMMIREG